MPNQRISGTRLAWAGTWARYVLAGDLQRGRERRDQIHPQPVPQPAFVAVGRLVVPVRSRAARRRPGPCGINGRKRGEPVQPQQAGDPRLLRVVLPPGPATRPATRSGFTRTTATPASSDCSTSIRGWSRSPLASRPVRHQPTDPGQESVRIAWNTASSCQSRATKWGCSSQSTARPTPAVGGRTTDRRRGGVRGGIAG